MSSTPWAPFIKYCNIFDLMKVFNYSSTGLNFTKIVFADLFKKAQVCMSIFSLILNFFQQFLLFCMQNLVQIDTQGIKIANKKIHFYPILAHLYLLTLKVEAHVSGGGGTVMV